MSFLPEFDDDVEQAEFDEQEDALDLGYRSFTLDLLNGRLLPQQISGAEAVRQYLTVLSLTARGVHSSFSEDYGTEIDVLIGESLPAEVFELEVADELKEALEADPRVDSVEIEIVRQDSGLVAIAGVTLVDGAELTVERGVDI